MATHVDNLVVKEEGAELVAKDAAELAAKGVTRKELAANLKNFYIKK